MAEEKKGRRGLVGRLISKLPFTGSDEKGRERRRNEKVGVVVSNKMQKSVVVAVQNVVRDQRYAKYVKRTSKFLAHCENNDCNVGDRVVIEETRPLSRRKRWNVKEVLERAS